MKCSAHGSAIATRGRVRARVAWHRTTARDRPTTGFCFFSDAYFSRCECANQNGAYTYILYGQGALSPGPLLTYSTERRRKRRRSTYSAHQRSSASAAAVDFLLRHPTRQHGSASAAGATPPSSANGDVGTWRSVAAEQALLRVARPIAPASSLRMGAWCCSF